MATVTLKFVNPAAAGKKFGSVVDTNGVRYPVGRGLVDKFSAGRTYEVTLEDQNWAGKPVTLITAIDSVRTPQNAPERAAEVAARQGGQPSTGSTGGAYNDRWWLPFCSNQIHALIAAGVIKDKASLNQWARDLKETVISVDAL